MRGEVQPFLQVPHQALAEVFPGFVSNLNVVAARSGGFKTGLLTDCIWHWADTLGLKGGIFGLEDGTGWAFDRLTARQLGIDYGHVGFARLHEHQMHAYQDWCERAYPVLQERLFVYDTSDVDAEAAASDTPIADWPDVLQEIKRWLAEGARFIVIDHGLRIRYTSDAKARYDLAIGRAMDTLANLGARHDCAIIVLWHLNRTSDEGSLPKMMDLKESGYLDAAMRSCLINWEDQDNFPGQVLITTVKHTRGAKGVTVALEKEAGGRFGLLSRTHGQVVDFAARAREAAEAKQNGGKRAKSNLFGVAS
jgi:replicative DNA helicase